MTTMLSQLTDGAPAAMGQALAPGKFKPYKSVFGGSVKDGARLYALDVELSGALLELLHFAEVSLRERMHQELTKVYTDRWFNDEGQILDSRTLKAIRLAKRRLGNRFSPGQLIAELNLGTWSGLLEPGGAIKDYDGIFIANSDYERTLWEPALRNVFAAAQPSIKREDAESLVKRIKRGRNRVAHFESIVFGIHQPGEATAGGKKRRQTPASFVRDVRELLKITSPDLPAWLDTCGHADELIASDDASVALSYAQSSMRKVAWLE